MSSEIASYIQIGISLTIFLFLLYQNSILRSQITKQSQIISDIEKFTSIFDLQKVEQFVKMREQTFKDLTEKEKREFNIEFADFKTKHERELKSQEAQLKFYNDMLTENLAFTVRGIVRMLPKDLTEQEKQEFILKAFPVSKDFVQFFLLKYETLIRKGKL